MEKYLIAGLGNRGDKYEKTRHNIGFEVLDALIEKEGVEFQKKDKLKGEIAKKVIEDKKIYFFKPLTYMNDSGIAVKKAKDFFKIDTSKIIIIVDDIDIFLGEFRLKERGSFGTHRGLQSIEENLNSQNYLRLRIGIKNKSYSDLSFYVLSKFSKEEKKELKNIIKESLNIIYLLLEKGVNIAMNRANIRKKGIKNEKK